MPALVAELAALEAAINPVTIWRSVRSEAMIFKKMLFAIVAAESKPAMTD